MPVQYPLIVSTLCQRLSLGTYVMSLLAVYLLKIDLNLSIIAAAALVVFCIGVFASLVHLGKPNRLLNSFANPKSHLTQEGIMAPFVGLFLFIQAINGWFISLSPTIILVVQLLGLVFSLLFIYSTGLVYQLFARPAWKTRTVGLNFFLSFLSLGSIGTYAWAAFSGTEQLNSLLYLSAITQLLTILGQLYYSSYVSKLRYGVAIKLFSGEFRTPYIGWVITGVVLPLLIIVFAIFAGSSATTALSLLVSVLLGLIFWRMFFFLAAKEIKFFPQYTEDMTMDY